MDEEDKNLAGLAGSDSQGSDEMSMAENEEDFDPKDFGDEDEEAGYDS